MSHFLCRQRGLSGKSNAVDGGRRVRARDRVGRAVPAPEANAEIQANLDVCEMSFLLLLVLYYYYYYWGWGDDRKSLSQPCIPPNLSPQAVAAVSNPSEPKIAIVPTLYNCIYQTKL